eukprot:scaffold117331_cov33-Prasinocladus_malaysianus.AAC.1
MYDLRTSTCTRAVVTCCSRQYEYGTRSDRDGSCRAESKLSNLSGSCHVGCKTSKTGARHHVDLEPTGPRHFLTSAAPAAGASPEVL